MSPRQAAVLAALGDVWDGDNEFSFTDFAGLIRTTALTRGEVRRACRALARKGLAMFQSGLWTDDGTPFGSGYSITDAGREALSHHEGRGR